MTKEGDEFSRFLDDDNFKVDHVDIKARQNRRKARMKLAVALLIAGALLIGICFSFKRWHSTE